MSTPELNLSLLVKLNTTDINSFIDYWSKLYFSKNERLYTDNIYVKEFDVNNIRGLFEWKNGTPLSVSKKSSLDNNIIKKIALINNFRNTDKINPTEYLKEFKSVNGPIWKIFLLHIIKPNEFPIYDQHVHRTFQYITNREDTSKTIERNNKIDFYLNEYCHFVKMINVSDLKKMDKAFFAFGQFLNTKEYKKIFN